MTDDEIGCLAHRTCFRYAHSENIDFRQYTFSKLTLRQFADEIERRALERAADLAFDHMFTVHNAVEARSLSNAIRALMTEPK